METNDNTSKELAVLLDLTQTEKDLVAFEERHQNLVYDVTTKQGMKVAKEVRAESRGMRTTVEKKRLEAGRVLLDMKKVNDEKARDIIARISVFEEPADTAIKAEESRVAAEQAAAALAEQERRDGHMAAIKRMRDFPMSLQGKPADVMQARIVDFANLPGVGERWDQFDEFAQEASDAHLAALHTANELLRRAREQEEKDRLYEAQQAELRAMQERNERLEREARERQEAEERRVREERERAEAAEIQRREKISNTLFNLRTHGQVPACPTSAQMTEIIKRHEDLVQQLSYFDFAEFKDEAAALVEMNRDYLRQKASEAEDMERAERAEQERRQAEAEQLEEQRRIDRERIDAELAAERKRAEEAERKERAQAAEAERQRIANLGLMEAVKAVVDWFEGSNDLICQPIADLIKVYDALPAEKRNAKPATKRART
jgi:hypothetical protein